MATSSRFRPWALVAACSIAVPAQAAQVMRFSSSESKRDKSSIQKQLNRLSTGANQIGRFVRHKTSKPKVPKLPPHLLYGRTPSLKEILSRVKQLSPRKQRELQKQTNQLLSRMPPGEIEAHLGAMLANPRTRSVLAGVGMRAGLIGLSALVYTLLGTVQHAYAYHDVLTSDVTQPLNAFQLLSEKIMKLLGVHGYDMPPVHDASDYVAAMQQQSKLVAKEFGLPQHDPHLKENLLSIMDKPNSDVLNDPGHVIQVKMPPEGKGIQEAQDFYSTPLFKKALDIGYEHPNLPDFDYGKIAQYAKNHPSEESGKLLLMIMSAVTPPSQLPSFIHTNFPEVTFHAVDPNHHEQVKFLFEPSNVPKLDPPQDMTVEDATRRYNLGWDTGKAAVIPAAIQTGINVGQGDVPPETTTVPFPGPRSEFVKLK